MKILFVFKYNNPKTGTSFCFSLFVIIKIPLLLDLTYQIHGLLNAPFHKVKRCFMS